MYSNLQKINVHLKEGIIPNILWANTMNSRCIGLMFQKKTSIGLLLDPCQSIHTFFMKFSLDCIYLDRNNLIVKVIYDIPPWRLSPLSFKTRKILELQSNIIPKNIELGQKVSIHV